jgi:transcriptional regulator with XRE-family HTH domain
MDTPIGKQMRDNGICIGNAISHLRNKQGHTVELIAHELAMDVNAYAMLEHNQLAVNDNALHRLARTFNVTIIELLTLQLHLMEAKDDSSPTATIQKQELERLEGLYQEQMKQLREEARYLRGLLDSLTNKG